MYLMFVLVSLYRSFKPRYYFFDKKDKVTRDSRNDDEEDEDEYLEQRSPSEYKQQQILSALPNLMKNFFNKTIDDKSLRRCKLSLSDSDLDLVYKQLSWAHTNVDFERVNWLNQIVKTFWPAVKALLNKFVFDDLLRPKKPRRIPQISKDLSKKKTTLSIYISSKRKLVQLRDSKAGTIDKMREFIDKSALKVMIYAIKLSILYVKQFIMDSVMYLINLKSNKNQNYEKKVNLEDYLSLDDINNPALDKPKGFDRGAKSWAGFDLASRKFKRNQVFTRKKKRKLKSAPGGLINPRVICKSNQLDDHDAFFQRNRLKLAREFIEAKNQSNKEIVFEKIKLGKSIPTVNGVKYVEEDEKYKTSKHRGDKNMNAWIVPSDKNNMKFMIELSYDTDRFFKIQLNSVPLLNRICLNKISCQIRFLITVNHTTIELNKDLDILDTPGDILFPAMNHVQLTLVDVPKLDWRLCRVRNSSSSLASVARSRNQEDNSKMKFYKLLLKQVKELFDPVHLINNSYFKYMVHMIMYLSLRWFQPFDIRVGNLLYLKTIC